MADDKTVKVFPAGAEQKVPSGTTLASSHETVDPESPRSYYRRLRRRLQAGLMLAFCVPLAVLSVYFHIQFNYSLKKTSKMQLITLAESQRNTVDLFIQERVINIFNLFHTEKFDVEPSQDEMWNYLQNLRGVSDAFIDVGFLTPEGVQIGYAGPFPQLKSQDYSHEEWFTTLMNQQRSYYISDVYMGFRNKPHFTIAVKQLFDGKPYIMRATLDPDKFYVFVSSIGRHASVDTVLVNDAGEFQVIDPEHRALLGKSGFKPDDKTGSGAEETRVGGKDDLVAYAWLNEVPWVLVVRQPLAVAYREMLRARVVLVATTAVLIALLLAATWVSTSRLLDRAQQTEESRRELKSQLYHASKLVSVGELAAGVAHEINNPLAIIGSQAGVIRDLLDPQFGLDASPEIIRSELDHIEEAVYRARDITSKLLAFVRKTEPRRDVLSVNRMLEDVVSGLMEKEFEVSNIKLVRDYDLDMPKCQVDPDQMRQVFLNLINNAGDAIQGKGTITLSTHHDKEFVHVTITDTGNGMPPDVVEKIFMPFFTTKEVGKGTGLGLSISLTIVEAMGGRMTVQSVPGAGSSFTISLPIYKEIDSQTKTEDV